MRAPEPARLTQAPCTCPTSPLAGSALVESAMPTARFVGSMVRILVPSAETTLSFARLRTIRNSCALSTVGIVPSVHSQHARTMRNRVRTAGGWVAQWMLPRAKSDPNGPSGCTSAHVRHAWLSPAPAISVRAQSVDASYAFATFNRV